MAPTATSVSAPSPRFTGPLGTQVPREGSPAHHGSDSLNQGSILSGSSRLVPVRRPRDPSGRGFFPALRPRDTDICQGGTGAYTEEMAVFGKCTNLPGVERKWISRILRCDRESASDKALEMALPRYRPGVENRFEKSLLQLRTADCHWLYFGARFGFGSRYPCFGLPAPWVARTLPLTVMTETER